MELARKTNGIEHGLLGTLVNQVPKKMRHQNIEPAKKAELEKKMKDDSEMVTVRYIHYKNQKTGTRYVDWSAGAGMPIFLYRFLHDQTYTVPKGLIPIINSPHRRKPVREGSLDDNGAPRDKDAGFTRIDELVGTL